MLKLINLNKQCIRLPRMFVMAAVVAAFCPLSPAAHALPTIFFDGNLTYTGDTGMLEVQDAQLKDTLDVDLNLDLAEFFLDFAIFFSYAVEETVQIAPGFDITITTAFFEPSSPDGPELKITRGLASDSPVWLAGDLEDVTINLGGNFHSDKFLARIGPAYIHTPIPASAIMLACGLLGLLILRKKSARQ